MLYDDLLIFLNNQPNDEQIVAFFQRVRTNQSNGFQIKESIHRSVFSFSQEKNYVPKKIEGHKDNSAIFLTSRYRSILLKYRSEGFGYGAIAKLLAKRGAFNKETSKAFSRSTIQRACNLLIKDSE